MAKILEEIKAPISREMKLFEEKFYQSMQSSVPLLDKITQFIIATKGKTDAAYPRFPFSENDR